MSKIIELLDQYSEVADLIAATKASIREATVSLSKRLDEEQARLNRLDADIRAATKHVTGDTAKHTFVGKAHQCIYSPMPDPDQEGLIEALRKAGASLDEIRLAEMTAKERLALLAEQYKVNTGPFLEKKKGVWKIMAYKGKK